MATSAGAGNGSFTPVAGQVYVGSKLEFAPFIAAAKLTAAGGFAVGGATPTVTIGAGAGTVGAISAVSGYDQAASFTLTAGTAALNGGTLATVTFGAPFDVAPASVMVNMVAPAGTVGLAAGACALAKTGFSIVGNAPASGAAYTVNWFAVRPAQ